MATSAARADEIFADFIAQHPTFQVSLHNGDPGATGANELPATGGYARVTGTSANFGTATGTPGVNYHRPYNAELDYGTASAAIGNVDYFGFWNAAGTVFLHGGPLDTARDVGLNDPYKFNSGAARLEQI